MKQDVVPVRDETWAQPSSLLPHFQAMMGPHGIYEHATLQTPLPREGYCTDDNARAVQLLVRLTEYVSEENKPTLETLLASTWQFLREARKEDGSFYNLRTAEGEWVPHDVSNDMYARLIRALTSVIRYDTNPARQKEAWNMLQGLRDRIPRLTASRAWAEVNVALAQLPEDTFIEFDAKALVEENTQRLIRLWHKTADESWPWFEDRMVYSNALLPHGLLEARSAVPISELDSILDESTNFLIKATFRGGVFVPIGSVGWYPREGKPSEENQQPIEAGTMFDLLVGYEAVFPGKLQADVVIAPYLWFYGVNTGGVMMANQEIGASYDGLFAKGPNKNYGAESMLAYLWAELRLRELPAHLQQQAFTKRLSK